MDLQELAYEAAKKIADDPERYRRGVVAEVRVVERSSAIIAAAMRSYAEAETAHLENQMKNLAADNERLAEERDALLATLKAYHEMASQSIEGRAGK